MTATVPRALPRTVDARTDGGTLNMHLDRSWLTDLEDESDLEVLVREVASSLSDEDKIAILSENAAKLFNIKTSAG